MIGFVVLALLTLVVAAGFHVASPRWVLCSLAAAVTSTVLFQGVVYLQLGYLDPFLLVAMATSLAVTVPLSFLAAIPFALERRMKGMP